MTAAPVPPTSTAPPESRSAAPLPEPNAAAALAKANSVAVIDGIDVDAVAAAVQGCPGVSALYGGRFGEIGSYLPGRRVAGVQVSPQRLTVQVRSRWDMPVAELSAQIRAALAGVVGNRGLSIVVADIDDPPAP